MRTSTFLLKGLVAGGSFALANPNPDPVANPEPQITVTPAASQSAAIASQLAGLVFDLGLEDSDEVGSVTSAIATAPPALRTAVEAALPNQATQDYPAFVSAVNEIITGTPSGFGALPTGVQSFVKSVAAQEASIFNDGGATAAPSGSAASGAAGRVKVAAAALGVGLLAALML